MKVLKKLLSVFLSAAIMVSMVCTGTVCASAADTSDLSVDGFYTEDGNYCIRIDGLTYKEYKNALTANNNGYDLSVSLFLDDDRDSYCLDMHGVNSRNDAYIFKNSDYDNEIEISAGFYDNTSDGGNYGIAFYIPKNNKYLSSILKCKSGSVIMTLHKLNNGLTRYDLNLNKIDPGNYDHVISVKPTLKKTTSKNNSVNTENKDDGSPYYFAYYQKYNKTEQVVLDGISKEEWNFLQEETKKGNVLTIVLKFTKGEQILTLYYSWYKGIIQYPYFITDGQFKLLNGKYSFLFTLSPTISEGARTIIKTSKTCEATIHITDGKTKELKNFHNLNELFNISFIDGDTTSQSKEKSISSLSFSKVSSMTYTGKARKPAVNIKDGDYTLKKGTDYTLTYKSNKNIGTATVTVKGKGKYTGSKTIEFKIVPKKTTLKVTKKSDTKAKFSWAAVDGAEKYQIYYSTDGKKYKKLATISGKKTSATLSGLDFDKYDYKFKIRSYGTNDGKKYYSSYSKTVTVK